MKSPLLSAAVLLMALAFANCSSMAVPDTGDMRSQMKQIDSDINDMAKNRVCAQDSECQTVGVGAKPCGGPKRYVVFSTRVVSETDMLVKANSYNNMDRQVNKDEGSVGTCTILAPPRTRCWKHSCVALKESPARTGPQ